MNFRKLISGDIASRFTALLTAAVAAVLLSSACGKTIGTEPSEEGGDWISFTSHSPKTRTGAGDTQTDTDTKLQKEPFGIYGFKSLDGISNLTNVFISSDAQEVGWGVSGGTATSPTYGWTYTPKRKWENSMHYSFRAYWPYRAEVNPASNATRIGIEYKSTTMNYDLLVAYATRYPLDEGIAPVTMQFHHALAGLKFYIKYYDKDDSTKGMKDFVTRFYLKGLYSVGYLVYGVRESGDDAEKIQWVFSENTFDGNNELFDWSGKAEFSRGQAATDTDKTAQVFDNDNLVFVIPQTLSSAAGATTANFYAENSGDALHTVKLPETELLPGKIYTFTFVVHSSYVTVNVSIKDWEVLQSNVDINL